ncbi:MAG: fumarylacetoacetate hydrolase family protein [ANME-2 cluster archaeon]|jgi:2-keto-4-pentenoate hydratase/2-oxohepta-3-ene-1,7-dioic acid hydratase in catechol pathway|nr:fumarylacetoacetate hydrolase family protein [ANME-2 cluster archaeon]
MIGRFKIDDEAMTGTIQGTRVIVEKDLYNDSYEIGELEVLPPVSPGKIICMGLNYADHALELGMDLPDHPIIFLKPPSAVIGNGDKILYPPESNQVDYEAELAVVIGKRCRNIAAHRADDVIMGYTCFNDVTARDLQKIDNQWTRAKSFDTFAPLGPYIIEPGEIDLSNAFIRSRVNGEMKQDSNISNMIFTPSAIVEFISHIMTLNKGDVIATGTPAGVGEMQPGDIVEVEIEGIGTLKNQVAKANA